MAISVVTLNSINETMCPPSDQYNLQLGENINSCSTAKKKKKKPKLKILGIAFYSADGKKLDGVAESGKVELRLEYKNPEGLNLFIEIPTNEDFVFEYNGQELTKDNCIMLTDGDKSVPLNVQFKA